jgi:hypothetical protein
VFQDHFVAYRNWLRGSLALEPSGRLIERDTNLLLIFAPDDVAPRPALPMLRAAGAELVCAQAPRAARTSQESCEMISDRQMTLRKVIALVDYSGCQKLGGARSAS